MAIAAAVRDDLRDAAAFLQARTIRNYVEEVRLAQARDSSCPTEEVEQWTQWALLQTDRIDPSISGSFLRAQNEDVT